MAVEIRELVIRAVIVDDANRNVPSASGADSSGSKDALIQECVNQVLKIIKRGQTR